MRDEIEKKALHPLPEECLRPTEFMNYDHPAVASWLAEHLHGQEPPQTKTEAATRLYYLVRDGWRYNPYTLSEQREESRADFLLTQKHAYCIPKALLLATFARAEGIPARLGFGDVRNHLSSPRLVEYLRSDIFAWHGFAELFLNGSWVRATPAFDARLCRKFNVAPLEFDGQTDGLFQEYDRDGREFMRYVRYRGVRADLPFEELMSSIRELYPHLFEGPALEGDLYEEGPGASGNR